MAVKTTKKRQAVAVRATNHPAAFKKVVCPKCKLGHAVQDFHDEGKFVCTRCGSVFRIGEL